MTTSAHPVPDPRDAPPLRWGVLGPGGIAHKFTDAVGRLTSGAVVAVASRDQGRADAFASRYGIPRAYAGYHRLAGDPEVDAVYVATPHSEHLGGALTMIAGGKHVLVEKPLVRSVAEADRLFGAARQAGVTVLEAMWMRFLPHLQVVRDAIGRGEIGDVVTVLADHGQFFAVDPRHRLFDPALAGGALLDLGVYPVSLAVDLLGAPETVRATGRLTSTGVDGEALLALGFATASAALHTTLWARTPTAASINGTAGRLELAGAFYGPTRVRLVPHEGDGWTWAHPVDNGFQYEAAELARCVADGRPESPLHTWESTRAVLAVLDQARLALGVVYPGE